MLTTVAMRAAERIEEYLVEPEPVIASFYAAGVISNDEIAAIIDAETHTAEVKDVLEQLVHHVSSLLYAQIMLEYGNHDDTGTILAERVQADRYIQKARAVLEKLERG